MQGHGMAHGGLGCPMGYRVPNGGQGVALRGSGMSQKGVPHEVLGVEHGSFQVAEEWSWVSHRGSKVPHRGREVPFSFTTGFLCTAMSLSSTTVRDGLKPKMISQELINLSLL